MKKSQYFNRPKNSKVLSVTNLRKIYGRKVAVDDIILVRLKGLLCLITLKSKFRKCLIT